MRPTPSTVLLHAALAAALCVMSPAFGAVDTDRQTDLYEDALSRYRAGDHKGAIVTLKAELQSDPRNLAARVLLGQALFESGQPAEAEAALRKASEDGADDALTLLPLGRAMLAQRKYEDVLSEVSAAGQADPLQAELLSIQGEALLALQRADEAKERFQKAMLMSPMNATSHAGMARLAIAAGQFDVAVVHSGRAVRIDPQADSAWYTDGDARRLNGDLGGAVASYGRAVALDPERDDARVARAAVLVDLKREDEALGDIETVLDRNPRQPQAAYLKAMLLSRDGKLDEAAAVLSQTSALLEAVDPAAVKDSGPLLLMGGIVANARGNQEQAREYLQRFIVIEPEHAMARRLLGTILVRQNQGRVAVDVLTPALRQAPSDAALRAILGVAYRQANMHQDSIASLAMAVKLAPSLPGLRIELARSRLAAGQRRRATQDMESVIAQGGPFAATAGTELARMRLEQGDADGAVSAARQAVTGNPKDVIAHLALGDALVLAEDVAGAIASYRNALAADPDSLPALLGVAGADLLQGRPDDAAARYRQITAREPKNIRALVGLARVAMAKGETTEAERWLENARLTDRKAITPQVELVQLRLREGRSRDALEAAGRLREAAPDDVRAVRALAQAQLAHKQTSQARDTYREARHVAVASSGDLVAVSRSQLILKDLKGARETLESAASRDPDHLATQAALVALDLHEKNNDAALKRARVVQARHPGRGLGSILVGDVMITSGRAEEAAAAYKQAIDIEAGATARVKYYQALWQAGRKREAIDSINLWLKAEPDSLRAQRQLAGAYLANGEWESAQSLHERLIENNPDDVDLLNNLAWLYQKRGDSRALKTAERAFELAPEEVAVLDTYGWITLESGEPEAALRLLRRAQARAASNPWIRFHTAMALSKLGRVAEARDLLSKLLGSDVPTDLAQDARALLDSLPKG